GHPRPLCQSEGVEEAAAELAHLPEDVTDQSFARSWGEDACRSSIDERSDVGINDVPVHDHTLPGGADMKRDHSATFLDSRPIPAGEALGSPVDSALIGSAS